MRTDRLGPTFGTGRVRVSAAATGFARAMFAVRARAVGLVIGLIAVSFGVPASAQNNPEGIYVTEIREVASGLILQPDGQFRWMFTTGALDLTAEGRWRSDGRDILLDTEPPVTAPSFEFLGSSREDDSALVVRIEDVGGGTPEYLDVEAQFDSGEPDYAHLDRDAYRFDPTPGRRIVAIRIGSAGFRFWSESYPVPVEANLIRVRFFPGDLGRADFRGTRAVIEGDSLTLPLMGSPVRYRRLTTAETAEIQGVAEEIEETAANAENADAPEMEPTAAAVEEQPQLSGPVEISIRGPIDPALDQVTEEHGNGMIVGASPIELRFRLGEQVADFGRISGERHLLFGLEARRPSRAVTSLFFAFQDRLLTLDEALERARLLEARLVAAGFVSRPANAARSEPEPFVATAHARTTDNAFLATGALVRATDWASATPLLADEAVGVSTMHLLNLRAGEILASAYIQNLRRHPDDFGGMPALDFTRGREWRLEVMIELDPEILERE